MTFDQAWKYPDNHPLSLDQAKALTSGDLGREHSKILARSCSPLYWYTPEDTRGNVIQANGTLTYTQSNERVFGVTAAHVVREYQAQAAREDCVLQLGNSRFSLDIIAIDDRLDLATVAIPPAHFREVGKEIAPVSLSRPNDIPQEGRGIMLCGFVGEDRHLSPGLRVDWGMFVATGIARRVNDKQITWVPDHKAHIPVPGVPALRRNKNLGGISGGPLIAWFEKVGGLLAYYSLAGVIVEANPVLENVIAIRTEFIRPDGTLRAMS